MRGQRKPKPRPELEDLSDATGFASRTLAFLKWLEVKAFSPATVKSRRKSMLVFLSWCKDNGIIHPNEVTRPVLERYQRWLFAHRNENDQPWSTRYQFSLLDGMRAFFSWMARNNFLLFNPSSEIELPKIQKTLPKHVLSLDEVERIMLQPDLSHPAGLRDRAMLETLYSTAIRRAELAKLGHYDVNMALGTLMVRSGKGNKDRVVPIGERALSWIQKYLADGRSYLLDENDCGALFLSSTGRFFNLDKLTMIVHGYVQAAGINKGGSCHLFRHTAATLMLENGADVRFIQAMLGHESITTTQLYTEVSIRKLKEVHDATHPGARLIRTEQS